MYGMLFDDQPIIVEENRNFLLSDGQRYGELVPCHVEALREPCYLGIPDVS